MSWPFGLTQLVSGEDLRTPGAQQLFCFYHYMFQMDLDILQQMQSLLLFLSQFSDGILFFLQILQQNTCQILLERKLMAL